MKITKTRKWIDYSTGTKAHSCMGGHWFKMDDGNSWKWNGPNGNGGTFTTPGADACGKCIELPEIFILMDEVGPPDPPLPHWNDFAPDCLKTSTPKRL